MNGNDVARWGSGPAVVAILEQSTFAVVVLGRSLRLSFVLFGLVQVY